MTGVRLDAGFQRVLSALGQVAGEGVGIVTFDNVPGRAVIDLFRRRDNAWLRRQYSNNDGTYRFVGLVTAELHDVVARDPANTWDDVIVGRVLPFVPVKIVGDAPNFLPEVTYAYAYTISGGEPPYTFSLVGSLPAGLALVATEASVAIEGVPSVDAVAQSYQIVVEDARGSTSTIADSVAGFMAHRYWRINVTAANTHCSTLEIEMAILPGGANQCFGGTVISGGDYPAVGHEKENAFDGSHSGDPCWASNVPNSGWIGYQFAAPIIVREVRIASRYMYGQSFRDFAIEYSDDGVTWTASASYANQTSWPSAAFLSFAA